MTEFAHPCVAPPAPLPGLRLVSDESAPPRAYPNHSPATARALVVFDRLFAGLDAVLDLATASARAIDEAPPANLRPDLRLVAPAS